MTRAQLVNGIFSKKSYLCVGLDTDISRIPPHLRSRPDAVFEFNQQLIDATKEHCVAYKINTAFYEALGSKGWDTLERTVQYIPPTHFTIADAKRGDIGNTSSQYAKAFFETLNFDAITVAPYMGKDSIRPFLEYENKWTIVLALTSNPGAADFELKKVITQTDDLDEGVHTRKSETNFLYETVLETVTAWGNPGNLMFVAGANRSAELLNIRKYVPENFLLVPGTGAQGGSLQDVSRFGMINDCGLLVNVSRAIIYASDKVDFAEAAGSVASEYQKEMQTYLPQL